MKFRCLLLVALSGTAFGQSSVRFDSNITTTASNVPTNASAPVLTVPNAIVSVCAYPPVGIPCTNTVPIFQDQPLTIQLDNPLTTDPKGRFGFWLPSGQYSYCAQNSKGQNVGCYPLTLLQGATIAPTTGAFNPSGCALSSPPFWCSGTDMGAWINAAISQTAAGALAGGFGLVAISPGNYSITTPISLVGYQNITLDCQGANLTWNGTAPVVINALQNQGAGTNATGAIRNCNVFAPTTAPANTIAFLWGNVISYKIEHNSAWNFNATGDVAFESENTVYFTEDTIITDNQARQDTVGFEFLKNCTAGFINCTNSMEYTWFRNNQYNSPSVVVAGATGLLVSGGITLQNSVVELHANINGPSGGKVVSIATGADQMLRDHISIQAEVDNLGPGTATCIANAGIFFSDGTLQCDDMLNTGNPVITFGGDFGYIGADFPSGTYAQGTTVLYGSTSGSSSNLLPDSEHLSAGTSFWQAPTGSMTVGNSARNTGHTDYGYTNVGALQTCISGTIFSQPIILPAGTYNISAAFVASGINTAGCTGPSFGFRGVSVHDVAHPAVDLADQFESKDWNNPQSFTLTVPTTITYEMSFLGFNFPTGAFIQWWAPQLEQGSIMTAYKNTSTPGAPLAGTTGALPAGAITAGTCATLTASISGATSGMVVHATPASTTQLIAGLHWDTAYVSAAGTVSVPVCNTTGGSVTPNITPTFNVRVTQ